MSLQHFFLRGEYQGSAERSHIFIHGTPCKPHGQAFFCPLCGELWALAPIEGEAIAAHNSICAKHALGDRVGVWNFGYVGGWQTPGSLVLITEPEFELHLPLPLLAREFLLEMALLDGIMTHYPP